MLQYRRSYAASVQAQRRMLPILIEIARLYLWRLLPGGKRARFYSVNVMRARAAAFKSLEKIVKFFSSRN
jgi:hypothetical protein